MRIRSLWLLLLLAPLTAHAQQASTNPISDSFRGFSYFAAWLQRAFEAIPADRYDYRPTPVQQTVGYIAQHLEGANYALCARFSGMARPMLTKDAAPDSVKAKWPKDTLVTRLRASFVFCRGAMDGLQDSRLGDSYPVSPVSERRTTRSRDVVLFLTDLADHYSQIANYMRLLGMVPPSAQPPRVAVDTLRLSRFLLRAEATDSCVVAVSTRGRATNQESPTGETNIQATVSPRGLRAWIDSANAYRGRATAPRSGQRVRYAWFPIYGVGIERVVTDQADSYIFAMTGYALPMSAAEISMIAALFDSAAARTMRVSAARKCPAG